MNYLLKKINIISLLVFVFFIFLPIIVSAQGYQPLSGLPFVPQQGATAADFVNAIFGITISIGALIAVIKIAIGGIKYMLTDVVTSKESAKADIYGSLLGLGILLAGTLILITINPNLTKLNVLQGLNDIKPTSSGTNNITTPSNKTGVKKSNTLDPADNFGFGDRSNENVTAPRPIDPTENVFNRTPEDGGIVN